VTVGVAILALKWVAWRLTGSVALFADAAESVVNVVAALAAWLALRVASQPPDDEHPFGHDKAEYFAAVFEGLLILGAGAMILVEAWGRLWSPPTLSRLGVGVGVSVVASAANGVLATYLVRVGRTERSPALVADGKHIAVDVATSVGIWIGMGLAWATGWWVLDPLLAVLVAGNVVRVGVGLVRESAGGLMDESLSADELDEVRDALREHMDDTLEVHDLRTRRSGPRTFVELHLVVPGRMSVASAHAICDRMEAAVAARLPGARTTIHVEPEREATRDASAFGPDDAAAAHLENP